MQNSLITALNARSAGAANATAAFWILSFIIPTNKVSARLYSTITSAPMIVGIIIVRTACGIGVSSNNFLFVFCTNISPEIYFCPF